MGFRSRRWNADGRVDLKISAFKKKAAGGLNDGSPQAQIFLNLRLPVILQSRNSNPMTQSGLFFDILILGAFLQINIIELSQARFVVPSVTDFFAFAAGLAGNVNCKDMSSVIRG